MAGTAACCVGASKTSCNTWSQATPLALLSANRSLQPLGPATSGCPLLHNINRSKQQRIVTLADVLLPCRELRSLSGASLNLSSYPDTPACVKKGEEVRG